MRSGERRVKRAPNRDRVLSGRLSVNPRGFGFVSTAEAGPDLFVPAARLGAAMHGDEVRVRVVAGAHRPEAAIVEIVSRGTRHVSGALKQVGKRAWIELDDLRLGGPVVVQGALPPGVRAGMAVIAEIVHYPSTTGDAVKARIVHALDADKILEFEVTKTLIKEGVSESFPEEVQQAARALPKRISHAERKRRSDLRSLELLTIDPEDARDHDDAVWTERRASGGFRVVVAIADVAHYVREGDPLDREALARGCTIYLPDRALPMLPEVLASDLASLKPECDRLAVVVDIELSERGLVVSHRLVEAVIRSRARLSYAAVAGALGLDTGGAREPGAWARRELLRTLHDVSRVLHRKRKKQGSLTFELPEARVGLDEASGQPQTIYRSRKDPGVAQAYAMIEELMLLANQVVARELSERDVPAIYRVHPPPDEQRMETFAALAGALGFRLEANAALDSKQLARLLNRIEGTPHAMSLGYLLLRAMQQASYDTVNIGHFGLAESHYVHFTSPIRRYPDLSVHRTVKRLLHDRPVRSGQAGLLAGQALESSRLERRAMQVERDVIDLYAAFLMQSRIGDTIEGVVTGVTARGFYVTLDEPFVSALCPVEQLEADYYELDEHGIRLSGRRSGHTFTLGDRLLLRVTDVSILRRQVYALPAEQAGATGEAEYRTRGRGRSAKAGGRKARPKYRTRSRPGPRRPRRG